MIDLLLALRGQEVLGRHRDARDHQLPDAADAERLQRRTGRDAEVVGGVLLDDGDARGGVTREGLRRP